MIMKERALLDAALAHLVTDPSIGVLERDHSASMKELGPSHIVARIGTDRLRKNRASAQYRVSAS
jgi:hypothetical protein